MGPLDPNASGERRGTAKLSTVMGGVRLQLPVFKWKLFKKKKDALYVSLTCRPSGSLTFVRPVCVIGCTFDPRVVRLNHARCAAGPGGVRLRPALLAHARMPMVAARVTSRLTSLKERSVSRSCCAAMATEL